MFSSGIDTQTMFWATGVEEFCSAGVFLWIWSKDRASEWIWWGVASGMRSLSSFVYFLVVLEIFGQWKWPAQFASMWLIMLSGLVSMLACTRMLKMKRPSILLAAPILIIAVSHFLLAWYNFDPRFRVATQSLALAYAMGWMARAVWKARVKTNIRAGIVFALSCWAVLQLGRAVVTIFYTNPEFDSPYAAAAANSWYFLVYQFVAMALPVLLISERNQVLIAQLDIIRNEAVARADRDGLTGLLNHKAIIEVARRMLADSRADNDRIAVAMVDCDYFKKINDEYGHQVGDAVLTALSGIIKEVKWPGCQAGRYGGEEFLLLLPGADESEASQVIHDVMKIIKSGPIVTINKPVFITVSVGISANQLFLAESPFDLIKRADFALLEAKKNGRDRFEVSRVKELEVQ